MSVRLAFERHWHRDMPYLIPLMFFDTSICLEVHKQRGNIDLADWNSVLKHLRGSYRCRISWVTWKELLVALARGNQAHWEENKRRLEALRWGRNPVPLDKPPRFAIREVLGISLPPAADRVGNPQGPMSKHIRDVLDAVRVAGSKEELQYGVKLPRSGRRASPFYLDEFDRDENTPQQQNADLLQGLRDGSIDRSSPDQLSAWLLTQCGVEPLKVYCRRLSPRLDAAYRYVTWLYGQAKGSTYSFGDNPSDWGDIQQLMYLCHPQVYILAYDTDFTKRTNGSPQADRILLYEELRSRLSHKNAGARPGV